MNKDQYLELISMQSDEVIEAVYNLVTQFKPDEFVKLSKLIPENKDLLLTLI